MVDWTIREKKFAREVFVPASKSQSIRALLFASLAKGTSQIRNLLPSPDVQAMARACEQLGARVNWENELCTVEGVAGNPQCPGKVDAGNSGLVLRFIGAVAALCEGETCIVGDESIRLRRPVTPLIEGLRGLGIGAESHPFRVRGPWKSGTTCLNAADSQPVSGLLIAAACRSEWTTLELVDVGERPWLELTLHWLQERGVDVRVSGEMDRISVKGPEVMEAFEYTVPADFSSLAFPLAALVLTQEGGRVGTMNWRDPQGDRILVDWLKGMGAQIKKEEGTLFVGKTSCLKGKEIDVNVAIDALPILAVVGTQAEGKTRLINGGIARLKESDRIACMTRELRKMGAKVTEFEDGLEVEKSDLRGATVDSHGDHRVAMALAVAALVAEGSTTVKNVDCVKKTYSGFRELFE